MRGDPEAHTLHAGNSLSEVLARLASAPGEWTPLAGGTEVMVAHAAGRLTPGKFISVWGLPELGGIAVSDGSISIGGGVTFGQLRRHELIASEFPLLTRAASWIGSIANQNRATLAGNIVNGSPAADAPPALLVYDAEIELVSSSGRRRMPYADFHIGYKRNQMRPDELVLALHLPRRFTRHAQYLRKVGTRRAMAITKVAIAGAALVEDGVVREIRLGAASLANRPVRLVNTESELLGRPLDSGSSSAALTALRNEVLPIDDIRSTAAYRRQVAVNLLAEFLDELVVTRGVR